MEPHLPADQVLPPTPAALLHLVMQSRAASLARAGNLQAAEHLLGATLSSTQPEADALDLLARIRVQQGAWLEAERLWEQVVRLAPMHANAQKALARLRATRRRPAWVAPMVVCAGLVVVLSALTLAYSSLSEQNAEAVVRLKAELAQQQVARQNYSERQHGVVLAELQLLADGQKALAVGLARADDRLNSRINSLTAARFRDEPPKLAFSVKGTATRSEGNQLFLWFEEDLFTSDGRLTGKGRRLLRTLARSIVQSQERIRVDVIGITGEIPSRDLQSDATSSRRAHLVASALSRTGVFPRGAVGSYVGYRAAYRSLGFADVPGLHDGAVVVKVSRLVELRR